MTGYERSDEDYQPLTWFRGYPIHATHLLVITHIVAVLICTLCLIVAPASRAIELLIFSSEAVMRHWQVWQVVTYAFVHVIDLNFVIGMLMLFWFGWEVERFLGRKVFLTLYGALLLTTPLVLLAMSAVDGRDLRYPESSSVLHFGIFIAFAVIYPNVQIFFGLLVKWIAWVLLTVYTVQYLLSARTAPELLTVFIANVTVAYVGVRYAGAGGGLAFLSAIRDKFPRKTNLSVVKPRLKPRRLVESGAAAASNSASSGTAYSSGGELHDSIDPLLDKISKHGLASLTHSERAALERARVSLLRKERGG